MCLLCRSFDTTPGQWQTVRLPFSDFIPVFRAKTLRDGQQLDASSVSSIQVIDRCAWPCPAWTLFKIQLLGRHQQKQVSRTQMLRNAQQLDALSSALVNSALPLYFEAALLQGAYIFAAGAGFNTPYCILMP